jgi:2-polyprenyl-6-hydroxyphenyl methylase/3-demethylubiquinone-9 3-methyltransferase
LLRLLPRGTHSYENFIKPSELAASVRAAALEPVKMAGMTYNPLTQVYALSADASVNYLMATRK